VLARRAWSLAFCVDSITFVIESDRTELRERIESALGDLLGDVDERTDAVRFDIERRARGSSTRWAVWRNGEPRVQTVTDRYLLSYVLWEITQVLFDRLGPRVCVHAAALERGGRALVLPGNSKSGKSTLAGWLTHRGWGFLTDEAAIIDPSTSTVVPYWRPIGIRLRSPLRPVAGLDETTGETVVPASRLGRLALAAQLTTLVFPSYIPGRAAVIERVKPTSALVELAGHFPGLLPGGREAFRRLVSVCATTPAYRLAFDDLDEAERALAATIDGGPGA
jgi:hypothetical protein